MSAEPSAQSSPDASPRVTVVMTARERFALTSHSIKAVRASTQVPFRFIFAHGELPDWLDAELKAHAEEWDMELRPFEGLFWPNHMRKELADDLDTDYVVFLDNDLQPEAGWLEKLIACADETGAGIVGPIYLWSDGQPTDRIHMAGGLLHEEPAKGGRVLSEQHRFLNKTMGEVQDQLKREPCGFVEYHCMLVRGDLVRDKEIFHDRINCVHEHIHASLVAREKGYETYIEPEAKVIYLAFAPYKLADLEFYRRRWDKDSADESIEAFAGRWNVIDDERSFGVRDFVIRHITDVDLLCPGRAQADNRSEMAVHELRQTLAGLQEQAQAQGYQAKEIEMLTNGYLVSLNLMNGGFRPCGRPFINHLAGTASVLLKYRFRMKTVAGGLLHAAYSHSGARISDPMAYLTQVARKLGGRGSSLERFVQAYTMRSGRLKALLAEGSPHEALTMLDVEVLAVLMANEIDMYMSGEYRRSGRDDAMGEPVFELACSVVDSLGVTGLAQTMRRERADLARYRAGADEEKPALPRLGPKGAFMFDGDRIVPMTRPAVMAAKQTAAASA